MRFTLVSDPPANNALMRVLPVVCMLIAAGDQTQNTSAPPLPAPGRVIDLGGWRLHLNCSGHANPSRPTIVLEASAGDFSVDWNLVQPLLASFARVCSYDRAGAG